MSAAVVYRAIGNPPKVVGMRAQGMASDFAVAAALAALLNGGGGSAPGTLPFLIFYITPSVFDTST